MKNYNKRRTYRIRTAFSRLLTVVVLVAVAALFLTVVSPEVQAADHMENSNGTIRYEYVNMRNQPNTSAKIVDVLYEYESVTFTGNYIEYFLNDLYPIWVEVEVDGHTGWIVLESVRGFSMR